MASAPLGRFALGTANLGNLYTPVTEEQAHAVLEAAWECGIRYFDTAPHCGLGLAERRLGAFLATKAREEFVVSTKVGRFLVPNPGGAAGLEEAKQQAALDDVLPEARARCVGVAAAGVFNSGLLATPFRSRPITSTTPCRRTCLSRRVRSPPSAPSSTSTCPLRRCTTRSGRRRCGPWSSARRTRGGQVKRATPARHGAR
jgi:aryl-alcohol dehydrogenase-like predicted oxidoreductase